MTGTLGAIDLPVIYRWFVVGFYTAAALLCVRAATLGNAPSRSLDRNIWWVTAALLLALAILREFDLVARFIQALRDLARVEGAYGGRRIIQAEVIAAIALGGMIATGVLAWFTRQSDLLARIALLALAGEIAFLLIRAISLHQIDILLRGFALPGIRWNWIFELGGVGIIALAAMAYRQRQTLSG